MSTCPTGKRRFEGKGEAKKALRTFQKRHTTRMRVYLCVKCHGWHFTSAKGEQ